MKKLSFVLVLFLSFACKNNGETKVVEMSCGQCQFGLTSQDGCDLAVRFDNQACFVDGADIDDFGDAHDKDTGFCEAIRKAEVEGELIGDRMKLSSVKLLD